MASDTHPLTGDPKWKYYSNNYFRVRTHFLAVPSEGKSEKILLTYWHYCREVIASQSLQIFKNTLKGRTINLAASGDLVTGECVLGLKPHTNYQLEPMPEEMIRAWDVLVGLPCLLLDPSRPKGDWWMTGVPLEPVEYWEWKGTTNFLFHHPALISIVLGLLRQTYFLFMAGKLPGLLAAVDYEEVSRILSECDRPAALRLIKKLRLWIQVPAGRDGSLNQYPVPWYARKGSQISYWERFLYLFRAVENHGLKEVFGGEPTKIWLESYVNGAFSFWGGDKTTAVDGGPDVKDKVTDHHKRLRLLGAPKKRQ